MTQPAKHQVKVLEHEGGHWVFLERFLGGVPEFSFDNGETWGEDKAQAFRHAKAHDKLVPEKPDSVPAHVSDDLAAVILELLGAMRVLRPGERLEVVHTGVAICVMKQEQVLSFRPSSLRELDPASIASKIGG